MADSDSFINEVTEEVRRDQLFAVMRRWGWLAGVIVVLLVGGAGWLEYQRNQVRTQSEAFGDALIAALDAADPDARIARLEAISPPSPQGEVLLALLAAGEAATGAGAAEAAERLRVAADAPDLASRYRDLAMLKAEMIDPSAPAEARLILGAIAAPGAPYAALAEEQLALIDIRDGDLEAGLDRLRGLERSAAATPGLQRRASQLIVALEAGSSLVDSLPEPEPEAEPAQVELTPAADDAVVEGDLPEADAGTALEDVAPEGDAATTAGEGGATGND